MATTTIAAASRHSSYSQDGHNDDEDQHVNDYCQPPNTTWDWERLNYYQLLDLVDNNNGKDKDKNSRSLLRWNGWNRKSNEMADTSSIDAKQIRKAYRRAAQLYHPDKASPSQSLSFEESNARFAKIAEAYEILSDPTRRKEYDTYLDHCFRHKRMMEEANAGPSLKQRFSNLFDSVISVDPFALFDDLFAAREGEDESFGYGFNSNGRFDPNGDDHFSQYHDESKIEGDYSEPSQVYQQQENLFDPMTGDVVVRISQTEEYSSGPSGSSSSSQNPGKYFYRVVSQDFKQRVDPYTGDVLLIPLTHPYLQEEGHRRHGDDETTQQPSSPFMFGSNSNHDAPTPPPPPLESILHSWEVMTPNSKLLVSPNGKYVAGLSPDCELLVMVDDDDVQQGDGIVWSSTQNGGGKSLLGSSMYGHNSNANQCFAILKGPHLIVALGGSLGHSHPVATGNDRILWYSDGEDDESASGSGDDAYFDYEDEFGMRHRRPRSYLAQLDNDGAITIYSVWSLPQPTGSAVASARDMLHGRVQAREYGHLYYPLFPPSSSSRPMGPPVVYKRCIYSTSRLGCSRVGRRLVQLSLEMYFRIKGILSRFNHATDAWLDLIYEEDDILLGLKESIWKNGHAFGSRMASSSARFVRRFIEFFEAKGM
jgi:curved DNA-binding protein CbpA